MYRDIPRRPYEYAITPRDDDGNIIEPDWDHDFIYTSLRDVRWEIDQIGV